MKISRLGLGVVSVLAIFASAAAIFGGRHAGHRAAMPPTVAAAAAMRIRVNGSQPKVPVPVLRLSGEVVELAQGAPLTVTATVGNMTFPASVQGNSYTVYIGRPAAQQMVTVEAKSPRVHYRSVIGSAGRLRTLAGSDALLTMAERPSLRVSPYSTALAWLVRYALGDRDATSDAEFEKTTRIAASIDLEYVAYTLAAIAKLQMPLPAGYTDGYQLVRDRDVFANQVVPLAGFREAAAGYLFDQPQAAALSGLGELPNQLAFVAGMPKDQLPVNAGDVFLLGRREDGRFDLDERLPTLDPINTLALDGQGRIQLTPVGNQVRVIEKPDQNYQYWWFDRTAAGRTLRRLTRGDATSIWVMRSVWNDRDQRNPSAPITQEVEYHVLSATELGAWAVQDGWSSVATSSTTLPRICAEPSSPEEMVYSLSDCGYVEHRFETDGSGRTVDEGWKIDAQTLSPTSAPARSSQFTWSKGVLGSLNVTDGKIATSFWRLRDYPAEVGPVFFHTKALTGSWAGQTMVGINMAARKTMASWAASAATGDWQSGSPDALPFWYTNNPISYSVQRMAGGTGQETYGQTGGQQSEVIPFWWQFVGNAVHDKRTRVFYEPGYPRGPMYVENCDDAGTDGVDMCSARVRYFKPVTRVGNRYFGIEDLYTQVRYTEYPEETQTQRLGSQLAFYECKSGACAPAGGMSAMPASQGGGLVRNGVRVERSPRPGRGLKPAHRPQYSSNR